MRATISSFRVCRNCSQPASDLGQLPFTSGQRLAQSMPHSRGRTTRLLSRVVRRVSHAYIHFAYRLGFNLCRSAPNRLPVLSVASLFCSRNGRFGAQVGLTGFLVGNGDLILFYQSGVAGAYSTYRRGTRLEMPHSTSYGIVEM